MLLETGGCHDVRGRPLFRTEISQVQRRRDNDNIDAWGAGGGGEVELEYGGMTQTDVGGADGAMAANLQNFLRQQYPQKRCEGHATKQGDVGEAGKHRCPWGRSARRMTRTQAAENGAGLPPSAARARMWQSRCVARAEALGPGSPRNPHRKDTPSAPPCSALPPARPEQKQALLATGKCLTAA